MATSRKRRAESEVINDDEAQQQEEDRELLSSIPELPTLIILEILSWLPIKTLFNCRRVCKSWLSLISDPHFAKLHLSRSHIGLLVKPIDQKYKSRKLTLVDLQIAPYVSARRAKIKLTPKINLPKDPEIALNFLNSCNGLLCLCCPDTNDPIYVCNPILGEYITLPRCPNGTRCDSRSSTLGFSPVTNQYKVVRFLRSYDRDYNEVQVYTLGEGLWRNIGKSSNSIHNYSCNAFVSGAIHWFSLGHEKPELITCFDFGSEKFRAIPGPLEFDRSELGSIDFMSVECFEASSRYVIFRVLMVV